MEFPVTGLEFLGVPGHMAGVPWSSRPQSWSSWSSRSL